MGRKSQKRGPGRPRLVNGEHKRYTLRLSRARLTRYRRAAATLGLPLATWMKRVLDGAAAPEILHYRPPPDVDVG